LNLQECCITSSGMCINICVRGRERVREGAKESSQTRVKSQNIEQNDFAYRFSVLK